MPAWGSQLSETDRWHLVNYLRSINGQGPTANPSASAAGPAAGPADRVALVFPVGFALVFGGWFVAGIRRSRTRLRRIPPAPRGRG
jgi:hypothetical protein